MLNNHIRIYSSHVSVTSMYANVGLFIHERRLRTSALKQFCAICQQTISTICGSFSVSILCSGSVSTTDLESQNHNTQVITFYSCTHHQSLCVHSTVPCKIRNQTIIYFISIYVTGDNITFSTIDLHGTNKVTKFRCFRNNHVTFLD